MRPLKIRKKTGLFTYQDFLIWPNEINICQTPVVKPKKFSKIKLIWLKYAPEWFKKYKRHKSHMKFLDKLGYAKDDPIRNHFGSHDYVEGEKARIRNLPAPKTEFTESGPPPYDKAVSVRSTIAASISEVRTKYGVKG
jgi:hypothetical protein